MYLVQMWQMLSSWKIEEKSLDEKFTEKGNNSWSKWEKKLTKKGNMMRLEEKEIDIGLSLYEVLNLWRSLQLTGMK